MGKRKQSEARTNRTIRLSEIEKRRLAEGANRVGMDESKYIRELILRGGADIDFIKDRNNLIRQISGIATNINQIARVANTIETIGYPTISRLMDNQNEVQRLLKELIQIWR